MYIVYNEAQMFSKWQLMLSLALLIKESDLISSGLANTDLKYKKSLKDARHYLRPTMTYLH